jgi:Lecithin retinol acyltransferase
MGGLHPGRMSFEPGDHLRDHRRRFGVPYTHHAIKVRDEQVVEFGGSTVNKAAMGIGYAPYERFTTGLRVDVVHHDGHDAALAIRRAEWLVSCPPTRRYNGIGFNCEHVARWCATGWETESLQIRHGIFGGKYLFVGLPLVFWLAWAQRTNRRLPNWAWLIVGANVAATIVTQHHYHGEIRHFNEHIRANCPRELRANIASR